MPVLQTAADAIAGGYAAFSDAADKFEAEAATLCDAPSDTALDTAREAFADTVDAWWRIELVKFGPVLADNAADRIFFYPDRRGIGLRQVQAALATEDLPSPTPIASPTRASHSRGSARRNTCCTERTPRRSPRPMATFAATSPRPSRAPSPRRRASGMERLNTEAYDLLWDEIEFELGNLTTMLGRAHDPATKPATLQDDVAAAHVISRTLRDTFASRMAPALGQTAAFSVLDGD